MVKIFSGFLKDISNEKFRDYKISMQRKMQDYLVGNKCRRQYLLSHFEGNSPETTTIKDKNSRCCDICDRYTVDTIFNFYMIIFHLLYSKRAKLVAENKNQSVSQQPVRDFEGETLTCLNIVEVCFKSILYIHVKKCNKCAISGVEKFLWCQFDRFGYQRQCIQAFYCYCCFRLLIYLYVILSMTKKCPHICTQTTILERAGVYCVYICVLCTYIILLFKYFTCFLIFWANIIHMYNIEYRY